MLRALCQNKQKTILYGSPVDPLYGLVGCWLGGPLASPSRKSVFVVVVVVVVVYHFLMRFLIDQCYSRCTLSISETSRPQ